MTLTAPTTSPTPSPTPAEVFGATLTRRRRWTDRVASALMAAALLVALVPLGAVLVVLVQRGAGVIGVDWFTRDIPTNVSSAALASKFGAAPETVTYGMLPAIMGTLLTTGLAALFAIPVGIMGAVYLHEYGRNRRLASLIRLLTDVMSGVPSVVMGIFVYTAVVIRLGTSGLSALAGGFALACLMLPIVVRSTEEMLRLVPDHLREASAAVGAPRWRTVCRVVLPAALGGIVSGAMLAVARAAGETAPLLFTIGSVTELHLSLWGQNTALSTQIYSNVTQPGGESMAWGAALTLIALVVLLTLVARLVTTRFSRHHAT